MCLFIKPKTESLPDSMPKKTRRQPARFMPDATSRSIVSTRDKHSQPTSTLRRTISLHTSKRWLRFNVKQSSANQTRSYPRSAIFCTSSTMFSTERFLMSVPKIGLLQKSHENGHPLDVIIEEVEYPKRSR